MYDDATTNYCSYNAAGNSGAGACAAPKANCAAYTGVSGNDNAAKRLNCSKFRD